MEIARFALLSLVVLFGMIGMFACAFYLTGGLIDAHMTGQENSATRHIAAARQRIAKLTRSPRHAVRQSVLAAPDRVSTLTQEENAFFFLHEVELHTRMELPTNQLGEVEVTKRQFKKLEDYLAMAPSTNPYEAFAHHGVALRVRVKDRSPVRFDSAKR